jgi:hypothetical protein
MYICLKLKRKFMKIQLKLRKNYLNSKEPDLIFSIKDKAPLSEFLNEISKMNTL